MKVIGGLDAEKEAISAENRKKLASFNKRVELASQLKSDLKIDENKGYAICPPGAFNVDGLINECMEKYKYFYSHNVKKVGGKEFMTNNIYVPGQVKKDSFMHKFVTDPKVLGMVCDYMGHLPVLNFTAVWHSYWVSDAMTSSHFFHCDWEDVRKVMIYIHLEDVTPDNGPTFSLDAASSKRLRDKIKYKGVKPDYRKSDEVIFGNLEQPYELCEFVGPKGTVVFTDGCRCFHYGSRMKNNGQSRLVAVVQYISPAAINVPPDMINDKPYRKLADNSELSQYLFGVKW